MKTFYFVALLLAFASEAEAAPFLTCANEAGDRLEIGWAFDRPFGSAKEGKLPACENQGDDRTGLEVTYPARGTTLTKPDGEKITGWVKVEFTNAQGESKAFYQYSDYVIRTAGCTQGFFRSKERETVEFRQNEPAEGQAYLLANRSKILFYCR